MHVALAAALAMLAPAAGADASTTTRPDRVVVALDGGSGAALRAAGAGQVERLRESRAFTVEVDGDPERAAARLEALPGVAYAEPDYVYRAARAPGDPLFDRQWSLEGEAGINAAAAWDQTVGGDAVLAVIDTGADLGHPDLAPNLWANPGEVPGNHRDDDGNGYVDDVNGWDFLNGDSNPADDHGHGTHVAGIAAARGGNGIGVAGVAWQGRIMVLKALDSRSEGTASEAAEAIRYAVRNGARVINTSFNGPDRSRALESAIQAAESAGVLVAASSGNDGRDIDAEPSYPASFPMENILAVGSTDRDGQLSNFSNHGARAVDLVAPGEEIVSTALGSGYERRTGTSMATPHVSGTLLLLAAAREDLRAADLRGALLRGARRAGGLDVASGALDSAAALRSVIAAEKWRDATPPSRFGLRRPRGGRKTSGGTVTLRWQAAHDEGGLAAYQVYLDGRLVRVARAAGGPPATVARVRVRAGRHRWRVVAIDRAGNRRASGNGSFKV